MKSDVRCSKYFFWIHLYQKYAMNKFHDKILLIRDFVVPGITILCTFSWQTLLEKFQSRSRSRLKYFHRDHEVLIDEATIG